VPLSPTPALSFPVPAAGTAPESNSLEIGWLTFVEMPASLRPAAPGEVTAAMGVLAARLTDPLKEDNEPEGSFPAPADALAAVRFAARILSAASRFFASSAS
jgi:hypothetical protein